MDDLLESIKHTLSLQEAKPSKGEVNALVQAYAKYMSAQNMGAPIKKQQQLYDKYNKTVRRLSKKYPDVDMSSHSFQTQLDRKAAAIIKAKVARGPGAEW